MKISSKAHYGLQATFLLAKENKTLSAKDLENEIDLRYLFKMLSEKEQEFIKRLFQGEKLNDVYQSLKMSKGTPKRIAEKIKKKI